MDEGYVALVECDPARSGNPVDTLHTRKAYRTGKVAHLKRALFADLFDRPLAPYLPFVFVEPGVIDMRQKLSGPMPPQAD